MATSSITRNFVIKGRKNVKMFAEAVESAYQDSLTRKHVANPNVRFVSDPDEIRKIFKKTED